ncbi:MAG: ABC transporter ATP-binding protein [Balneolales bacterium]|nr:ABC transporter ATP-binding protein [Balneolales bacterium]
MEIRANQLTKSFGNQTVLSGLTFEVKQGSTLGLLGNNGAGKSTLIHLLMGLNHQDSGELTIDGLSWQQQQSHDGLRSRIGVLPEHGQLNPELTGAEQLRFTALLYGIDLSASMEQVMAMAEYLFEDLSVLEKRCGTFSTGMKKKLGLILAFLHKPQLVLLDEPFSGLDPGSSRLVINFLNAYSRRDRVILVSSHNLSYVEQVATDLAVLHESKFRFFGSMEEFTRSGQSQLESSLMELLAPEEKSTDQLRRLLS